MLKFIARLILRVAGWRSEARVVLPPKAILCVAPHTSNWDLFWGQWGMIACGVNLNYVIKNRWTKSPIGWFLTMTGAVGIDRSRESTVLVSLLNHYRTRSKIQLAITPEGTRQLQPEWKKGVLIIARKMNLPVHLIYIDYALKEVVLAEEYTLTGNEAADWDYIRSFYRGRKGKYPAQFTTGLE